MQKTIMAEIVYKGNGRKIELTCDNNLTTEELNEVIEMLEEFRDESGFVESGDDA